jgi:small subunit ribosomal protein S16
MALKIRLQRHGASHRPFYRLVVTEATARRDGRFVEVLGTYEPQAKRATDELNLKIDRIDYWKSVGAKPTDTAASLIRKARRDAAAEEAAPVAEVKAEAPATEAEAPAAEAKAPAAEAKAPAAEAKAPAAKKAKAKAPAAKKAKAKAPAAKKAKATPAAEEAKVEAPATEEAKAEA